MRGSTKRRIGGVAIAGMVIAGVAAFSSMSASGADLLPAAPEADPKIVPLGTLSIELTDRAGWVTFDPFATGAPNVTQEITTQQPCATVGFVPLLDDGGNDLGNLLSVGAFVDDGTPDSTDTVQLPGESLGVQTDENCGVPAGLIGPLETLTLGVGDYFDDLGAAVKSASLQIGKARNPDGNLTVGYDGGAQSDEIPVATGVTQVTLSPDDSLWYSPEAPFSYITLQSTANQNSRGLGVRTLTTFELVQPSETESAVFCQEQVTSEEGGTGEIAEQAVFFRGENKTGGATTCEDVAVEIDIVSGNTNSNVKYPDGSGGFITATDFVYWNTGNNGIYTNAKQGVQGLVEIVWAPVPSNQASKLDRWIDYDGYGPGAAVKDMWCESFTKTTDSNGNVTFTAVRPVYTEAGNIGGRAPWCLVSDERELVNGQIYQTQVMFGGGDPMKW